jgi:hypothetical protein
MRGQERARPARVLRPLASLVGGSRLESAGRIVLRRDRYQMVRRVEHPARTRIRARYVPPTVKASAA